MCGLAGILRFDGQRIDREKAQTVLDHLRMRGPDGEGLFIDEPFGLAHTSLSILDILYCAQPMSIPATETDGELYLVFNGEIYNHRAIRKKLERLGHKFLSDHCDTEVVLHGYRQYGEEIAKHLHGMFSILIWDAAKKELFLMRDRVGKKPIYYYQDAMHFVCANQLAATLSWMDQSPRIDEDVLSTYLTFGYTGQQSFIRNLKALPPGHWMKVNHRGEVTLNRYWQPPPLSRTSTAIGLKEGLEEIMVESVASRLESDVPIGCLLSGGLDSAMIAAIAKKKLDVPLHTYSVKMPHVDGDEVAYARQIAQHLGTEHTELEAFADVESDLHRLVSVMGEPIGKTSVLGSYWMSKAVRPHIKVAISGDGGNELFGGYQRYDSLRLLKAGFLGLKTLPTGIFGSPNTYTHRVRANRMKEAGQLKDPPQQYLALIRLFKPEMLKKLGVHEAMVLKRPPGWETEHDPAEAARRWDLFNSLPYDLLRRLDHTAMSFGLEVRCPYLDTSLLNLAGHVPLSVLAPHKKPKFMLKELASHWLPKSIINRTRQGFDVPIGKWFSESMRPLLEGYLLETNGLKDLGMDHEIMRDMIHVHCGGRYDHSERLFALLTLAIWLEWLKNPVVKHPIEAP